MCVVSHYLATTYVSGYFLFCCLLQLVSVYVLELWGTFSLVQSVQKNTFPTSFHRSVLFSNLTWIWVYPLFVGYKVKGLTSYENNFASFSRRSYIETFPMNSKVLVSGADCDRIALIFIFNSYTNLREPVFYSFRNIWKRIELCKYFLVVMTQNNKGLLLFENFGTLVKCVWSPTRTSISHLNTVRPGLWRYVIFTLG